MGTESHSPSMPKNRGKMIILPAKKINVREKEITAEINPLPKAVNKELANVLNPTKSNAAENNLFP